MATTATVAVTTVAMAPGAAGPSHAADEDAAKKKSTDCVYFLASPLTCKKGDECEFRHSESARMNPRDCWYWVGGGCRNRDCSFRHPPLESRGTTTPAPPATPVHPKKPVPCYFFSQGCCNKGSKCQFLHEGSGAPNVYRLSDKSPTPVSERKASEASTESTPEKASSWARAGKPHKDIYTWKLSDKPAPEKQAEKQPGEINNKEAQSKGRKKSEKRHHHHQQQQQQQQQQQSSSHESERRRSKEPTSSGSRNEENFAAPKSLAQIKEEKRRSDDVSKRKLKELGRDRGDSVRRKLCNGSASIESAQAPSTPAGGEDDDEVEIDQSEIEIDQEPQLQQEMVERVEEDCDEEEDDFAKRLEALSRTK